MCIAHKGEHIGAIRQIQLNRPFTAAMQSNVKVFWPPANFYCHPVMQQLNITVTSSVITLQSERVKYQLYKAERRIARQQLKLTNCLHAVHTQVAEVPNLERQVDLHAVLLLDEAQTNKPPTHTLLTANQQSFHSNSQLKLCKKN